MRSFFAGEIFFAKIQRQKLRFSKSQEVQMNDVAHSKLILNDGESIKHENHRMKGTLQETDIDTYAIQNAA